LNEWDEDTPVADIVDDKPQAAQAQPGERDRAYLIMLTGSNVGEMIKIEDGAETVLGRGDASRIQVIDDGASRRHAIIKIVDGETVIEDLGSTNGTYVNGQRVARHRLVDGDKIQIGATTILKFTYHDNFDESFQRRMFESALRDGLTQAYNKRYFLDRLDTEFKFAKRHDAALALVLMDIDHFKQVNDVHGHIAGDHVLASVARKIRDSIRNEDVFARYGGEEFAILSRAIDADKTLIFAERLRRTVEAMQHVIAGVVVRVTISLGIAGLPYIAAGEPLELLAAADDALYAAKRTGRNRVCIAGRLPFDLKR
jgi:diguanylate cyclase (GGDEF)-like protein